MNATQAKPAAEQNPVEVPLYTLRDVVHYARCPLSMMIRFDSEPSWSSNELFVRFVRDELFFTIDAPKAFVSFRNFADLFLRAGALRALSALQKSEVAQRAFWHVRDWFQDRAPLERLPELGEPYDALVRKHLALRAERVEMRDGVPVRLYPPTRDPEEASPRLVVMDPRVRFGRPVLAGRGVPTDALFERFRAGDSPAELAADYDLTTEEVDEAIRYEATPVAPLFPFGDW